MEEEELQNMLKENHPIEITYGILPDGIRKFERSYGRYGGRKKNNKKENKIKNRTRRYKK